MESCWRLTYTKEVEECVGIGRVIPVREVSDTEYLVVDKLRKVHKPLADLITVEQS